MTRGRDDLARLAFEAAGVGIYAMDRDGVIVVVNAVAVTLTGWTADELVGRSAHDTLHRPEGTPPDEVCRILAVAHGGAPEYDDGDLFWRRDGSPVPVWWVAAPPGIAPRPSGALGTSGASLEAGDVAAVVVFGDASERYERSQFAARRLSAAEAESARLTILGRLSDLLNSLDILTGLDRVADLVVQAGLADATIFDRIDSDGGLARVSLAAVGLEATDAARELHPMPTLLPTSSRSLAHVLRGADHVVVDTSTPEPGRPWSDPLDEAQAQLFDVLGATQAVVVPLAARGRILGAMTWVRRDKAVDVTSDDLLMARLFALRIGQWMENLRLNDLQHQAAVTLQRSLLTALPESDALTIAGRYLPAAEGIEVGGDWYDAVLTTEGHIVIAIGDVSGHDMTAATRMAQLRNMLRFAVLQKALDPAGVLEEIDRAIPALDVGGSATAILAVIPAGGADAHELLWSSAGHLPPLLVHADGATELLEQRPDLLLGVDPRTTRTAYRSMLPAGSTLVLYTDGLVERRGENIDDGLARLVEAAGGQAGRRLDDLCDGLLKALVPAGGSEDDIAVLALRVRPT